MILASYPMAAPLARSTAYVDRMPSKTAEAAARVIFAHPISDACIEHYARQPKPYERGEKLVCSARSFTLYDVRKFL